MNEKFLQYIDRLSIKSKTKKRFKESFDLMLSTNTKSDGLNLRFELGGMLSSLEAQGVISTSELKTLNHALGDIWKAKNKAFFFTERAIKKAQIA